MTWWILAHDLNLSPSLWIGITQGILWISEGLCVLVNEFYCTAVLLLLLLYYYYHCIIIVLKKGGKVRKSMQSFGGVVNAGSSV